MGLIGFFVKGCRAVGRGVSACFNRSKAATKIAKAVKARKTPIPVGKPAAQATTAAAEPKGFFARLAELNENKAYQEYKEVFNQGLPFDHYMYMH